MFCRAKDDVTGASHPSSSSNALPHSQPNLNGEPTRSSLLPDTLQHDPRLVPHHVPELSFCGIAFSISWQHQRIVSNLTIVSALPSPSWILTCVVPNVVTPVVVRGA